MTGRAQSPSLALTYALLAPETAEMALEAMPGVRDAAIVDGLAELVLGDALARVRVKALHKLAPLARDAWLGIVPLALRDPLPSLRSAALQLLSKSDGETKIFHAEIAERVRVDPSWTIRRSALELLPRSSNDILVAADDPHWRVRLALIESLADIGDLEREQVVQGLRQRQSASLQPHRVAGVIGVLEYLWHRRPTSPAAPNTGPHCPFWDWDDAVLARRLEEMTAEERRENCAFFPALLTHGEPRVRSSAAKSLRRYAGTPEILAIVQLLAEPRWGMSSEICDLLQRIDADRALPAARAILEDPESVPTVTAWAVETVASILPQNESLPKLRQSAVEPSPPAAYASHRRAAELTPQRAAELIEQPDSESSWHVLAAAARMCRVPLWNLAPGLPRIEASPAERIAAEPLAIGQPTRVELRALRSAEILVSRMGLSGHYGLPVEGFIRGVEAGVNLLFWEPNYDTLTQFARRIDANLRDRLHFVAGSFEAEPARVRKDVERALRNLRLETLSLFVVFWVRSPERIRDDLRELLERLQKEGKIRQAGLSTHDRAFAADAIEQGWNPVMVRHSAVHCKAEQEVFPSAVKRGTSIITFSNTCYGRLVKAIAPTGLTAADCYRYTLAQPGVTTCLTAPATVEQLEENLRALAAPKLGSEPRETLRRAGAQLYQRETLIRQLVRDR